MLDTPRRKCSLIAVVKFLKSIETSGKHALRFMLVGGAIRALRRKAAELKTIEDAVVMVRNFNYCRIKITSSQVASEIIALLKLLAGNPPKTLMELGTNKGGTFFLFTRVAAPDATLVSLDLPPELYTGGYKHWQGRLYATFGREQQQVKLLRADSHNPRTVDLVQQATGGRKLDFLLIDGDHSYAGVKRDFELYSPLVAPGGLVALHDIVPGSEARVGEVPRFWQELKGPYRLMTEFVADWQQGTCGIGVIQVPVKRDSGGQHAN